MFSISRQMLEGSIARAALWRGRSLAAESTFTSPPSHTLAVRHQTAFSPQENPPAASGVGVVGGRDLGNPQEGPSIVRRVSAPMPQTFLLLSLTDALKTLLGPAHGYDVNTQGKATACPPTVADIGRGVEAL